MRFRVPIWILLVTLVLLFAGPTVAQAAPPDPSISQTPPLVPEHLTAPLAAVAADFTREAGAAGTAGKLTLETDAAGTAAELALQSANLSLSGLPPLKAVLLVGPIDGDYGTWTEEEKASMDLAAAELQANGVTVHKFYTPNNDWNQIKQAAEGAHFLFYRGHGVFFGDANSPSSVGGFALKDGVIPPEVIRSDLKLAPNAIIMIYGCYAAGSSSSDTQRLSSAEAQRRAALYAQPFLDNGAGGYYANWFGNAFQMYIRFLFQGKTLGQAYESYFDYNAATVERYLHPVHTRHSMWIDKDEWYDPKPQYNNAFIGQPSATLADLFASTPIEIVPNTISHIAEPFSGPRTIEVQINTSAPDVVWTASITPGANWIQAPSRGSASDPIRITVTPPQVVGTYEATITVQASNSSSSTVDLAVPITLRVAEDIMQIYLPGLIRGE